MLKNTQKGLSVLLLSGASFIAMVPATALAQNNERVGNETLGSEIVVTGSRVRGEAPVGATVIAVGRSEIEKSPALTVDRIIKELPQNFDLGVSENSRAQAGGSGNITFGNSVNLRGIGPYATLVVVDGHRVVNNSRSTDPSIIPTLGVERVEVVADGASAIYGSDAVAGVVNIIPRRNLDGGEVFGRYGVSDDGDFTEYSLGAALGKVWEGGQVMVAYEHVDRSNLSGMDRDFFTSDQREFDGNDYRVTRCAPGTLRAGSTTYALPGQLTQANAGQLVAGTTNLCDSNTGQDLVPEQSYDSVNATATLNLSPWVELFADAFYSKRKFVRRTSYASASFTVPETNAFFVRPSGFTGSSYVIDYSFENDIASNDSFGSAESWQITPGVRLNFGPWRVEGLIGYGKTKDISNEVAGLDNRDLATALASGDPATAVSNPMDLTAQALVDPDLYRRALEAILLDPKFGSVIFAIIQTDHETSARKFPAVIEAVEKLRPDTPIIFAGMDDGAEVQPDYVQRLRELGVAYFPSADRALRAVRRYGEAVSNVPERTSLPPLAIETQTTGTIPEYRAKQVLAPAGIDFPEGGFATDLETAKDVASRIGYPVVLKAQSPQLSHKSDAGGVLLNIGDESELSAAWEQLFTNVAAYAPGLMLDGALVEKMGPRGTELIVGVRNDPEWGAAILVGFGGVQAELYQDVRLISPHLSAAAIEAELLQLKGASLLTGFRGSHRLDIGAAARLIERLGQVVRGTSVIAEIDLNPVVVFPEGEGCVALDALMTVK